MPKKESGEVMIKVTVSEEDDRTSMSSSFIYNQDASLVISNSVLESSTPIIREQSKSETGFTNLDKSASERSLRSNTHKLKNPHTIT